MSLRLVPQIPIGNFMYKSCPGKSGPLPHKARKGSDKRPYKYDPHPLQAGIGDPWPGWKRLPRVSFHPMVLLSASIGHYVNLEKPLLNDPATTITAPGALHRADGLFMRVLKSARVDFIAGENSFFVLDKISEGFKSHAFLELRFLLGHDQVAVATLVDFAILVDGRFYASEV